MRTFLHFLRLLFVPCDEIAHLASRALDAGLPRYQRVAIAIHFAYCKACRRYRRQMLLLRRALRAFVDDLHNVEVPPALTPEARNRLKRALRQR
jgi:predicted anti-sigma-YlaC factor YlaD